MKNFRYRFLFIIMLILPCSAFSDEMQDLIGQYSQMGENTTSSFPKELESLFPESFTLKTKNIIFKETSNMFLVIGLGGNKQNTVYPKFGDEATIEVQIFGYNPQTNPYMSSQFPVMFEESKKGYSQGNNENSSGYEYGPVVSLKINQADVYIQKMTKRNVELDDNKTEDQIYYNADVLRLNGNMMMHVTITGYPLKNNELTKIITDITKVFNATQFTKYMK